VKPGGAIETCTALSKAGATRILSIAAGVSAAALQNAAGTHTSVVRAMPNTPSIVGHGVTGIAKGKSANDNQLALAKDLFETVGQVIVVDEEKINALSTISGSGPAYVFYFAEKLMTAAKKMGFSEKEANLMVRATFLGSATLLAASSDSPETLRAQVTSPNGTTMQATARFDEADLQKVFIEATEAALARAIELGKNK
jgi:pyrroline-5-carboxylate reductase